LSVDGLPSTLQRLAIMHRPTSKLTGALPVQLKHLEVLLVPLDLYRSKEVIEEAARSFLEQMDVAIAKGQMSPNLKTLLEGSSSVALAMLSRCDQDPESTELALSMVPPSLETLVLLFDENELGLELPALLAPPEDEEEDEVEDEVEPPQAPLERLANRLDEKYKFTGSLQHATSLRLVRCKVLYSGEVPTHSPLELERLRDYVSSRCKPAATVVFQVSSSKKFV
jgi:hypothetical protein